MKKILLTSISLILIFTIGSSLAGCSTKVQATDLMKNVIPNQVAELEDLSEQNADATDFAIRLFKASANGSGNTLISPLSVLYAIAMTANGAKGETRAQIEEVLGMSIGELNLYLSTYANSLPKGKKYELSLANSLWLTEDERFTVEQSFLQTNADYYGADIYKAPFDDRQTVNDINNWVKNETDGMISDIIDKIPPEAVMYIVNALAFEAEWDDVYEKNQVRAGIFTKENGEKENVEMMYGSERVYLEDENATGFVKYYSEGKYAFVALLPDEDISISEYIASLDGETVRSLLDNGKSVKVNTAIPKFNTAYDTEMSDLLVGMGMKNAFDPDYADFTGLGRSSDGNIFISRVIHKTQIQVGEKGTKAGASTVVEMANKMSASPDKSKQVYLNRPFVYMLIDCENNIPFFIGAQTEINN